MRRVRCLSFRCGVSCFVVFPPCWYRSRNGLVAWQVSLASPVYYGGDFRPHFTTFDPDYREIVAAHDKVSKQQIWG